LRGRDHPEQPPMTLITTARLELVPITLAMVEAVMLGRKEDAERLVKATMPSRWPNPELIERAFTASLDDIRANPAVRLWGDRVLVARAPGSDSRVIGSVVFHGRPGADGIAEIAYGVEEASQGKGYATEAVQACVRWALGDAGAKAVQAATFAWHTPSLRVIQKVGMTEVGTREHETMGEMLVFERRRDG
jgi:[ribosomal protein S5]-alanine N-acetyltransferase